MELKTNSNCELILDGSAPDSNVLEVIVYGDKYEIVQRDEPTIDNYWVFDMPEDGLYQYYTLYLQEEPNDLLEYIQDNSILPEAEIFSICKLRNCLLQKEKEYINKFLSGCKSGGHCAKGTEDELVKDFLLSTVFVLEYLICAGKTVEALRILKNINNSCGFCSDNKTTNNCGCSSKNTHENFIANDHENFMVKKYGNNK